MKLKSTIVEESNLANVTYPCLIKYKETSMVALILTKNGPGFQLTSNNFSSVGTEWPARDWIVVLKTNEFSVVNDITINFHLT